MIKTQISNKQMSNKINVDISNYDLNDMEHAVLLSMNPALFIVFTSVI